MIPQTIFDLVKGKKMIVETNMGVSVELEIKEIEPGWPTVNLEPATPENDWWPAAYTWTTYKVQFPTGKSKEYNSLNEIRFY